MDDQTLSLDDQDFLLQAFEKKKTELGRDVHYKYTKMVEEMEREFDHLYHTILFEKPKKIAVNEVIFEMQS